MLVGRVWKQKSRAKGPSLIVMLTPLVSFALQGCLAWETGDPKDVRLISDLGLDGSSLTVEQTCVVSDELCTLDSITTPGPTITTRNVGVIWALITLSAIMSTMNISNANVLSLPIESPVRKREMQSNLYTAGPYFFSKVLVEWPVQICFLCLAFMILYFMAPLQGGIMMFLILAAHAAVTCSLSWLFAVKAKRIEAALQLSNLFFLAQFLFSGLLVPILDMPSWMRWAEQLSFMKYSINLLAIVELGDERTAQDYLRTQNVHEDRALQYW